ncbi:histidine phosphatase family protein [Mycolicibacterium flavescens]|uniref:histidine phosphatase family protein n=1 Tax=Mycolicibacterium flavescens TaxID=1776 RepID=UPI0009FE2FA3|nr:histidine phosphatase family protein [Mycolicibacterium flavescens]MCV7283662.1 histidine phosphatase family protein [Mycolicibacterium flavescens]
MRNSSTQRILRIVVAAVSAVLLVLVAAVPSWAMTVTFVRHAESQANAAGVIDTSVPGPGLSPLGEQQALDAAAALVGNGYDGIYVSSMLRTQQTAQPLLDLLPGSSYEVLPGLREISAGVFEGASEDEGLGRLGYALAPAAWMLGARFLPVLGGEDGNAFDARVDGALKQIADNGDENAVAFAHGATIMFWVMMNVDNPDFGLMLSHQLGNTEAVVVEGSPEEGWTLVSWAGRPVSADPSLPTKLFVNVRDLVVAPQTALYNVGRAFASGDVAALANAVRDGIFDVTEAVVRFIPDTVRDIVDEFRPAPAPTSDQRAPQPEAPAAMTDKDTDDDTAEVSVTRLDKRQKTNGATDLTGGNKVAPGDKVDTQTLTDEVEAKDELEVVDETEDADNEAPTTDDDESTDGEDADASSEQQSEQQAA